jgi:hypothetical protein
VPIVFDCQSDYQIEFRKKKLAVAWKAKTVRPETPERHVAQYFIRSLLLLLVTAVIGRDGSYAGEVEFVVGELMKP